MTEKKAAFGQPFRLLDLPLELVGDVVLKVAESSIPPDPEAGTPGRHLDLAPLSRTCTVLKKLCRPLLHQRLFVKLGFLKRPFPKPEDGPGFESYTLPAKLETAPQWDGRDYVRSFWADYDPDMTWAVSPRSAREEFTAEILRVLPLAVSAFSQLAFLSLDSIDETIAAYVLQTASNTVRAVSLSNMLRFQNSNTTNAAPSIPYLPHLLAIKLFECPHRWCSLVTPASQLQHLCIWLPTEGFLDLDWLTHSQILTINTLNLDGFKQRPRLLADLLAKIQASRATSSVPLALRSLDIEAVFNSALLNVLLEGLSGVPLRWLAISCIDRREMSPSVFQELHRSLPELRFLLVMVGTYNQTKWPGDMDGYTAAVSQFKHLTTFAHNHLSQQAKASDDEETSDDYEMSDDDEMVDGEDWNESEEDEDFNDSAEVTSDEDESDDADPENLGQEGALLDVVSQDSSESEQQQPGDEAGPSAHNDYLLPYAPENVQIQVTQGHVPVYLPEDTEVLHFSPEALEQVHLRTRLSLPHNLQPKTENQRQSFEFIRTSDSLTRVINVAKLFANEASGAELLVEREEDGQPAEDKTRFDPEVDLRRILLPFEGRWASL